MMFQISYTALFAFLSFLLLISKKFKLSYSEKSRKTLPPGPWRIPLIGNLHQFVGSLAHHSLRSLAYRYGPLMHLQLGELSHLVVSTPEMAKEIMKTHDVTFSNRPYTLSSRIISYDSTNIAFSSYGSYWRQLRKLCTVELLTAKRVQSLKYIREEEVSSFIKALSSNEGSIVNLSKKIFSLTNAIVARSAFGEKSQDQESFISTMNVIFKLGGGYSLADLYPSIKLLQVITGMRPKLERLGKEIDKILEKIIRNHREKNSSLNGEAREDLVDVLLKFQQQSDLEHPLTDDNIKAVVLDIFTAGTETSSTTLEWAMAEMMKNPRAMEEAQAEVRRVCGGKGYVDEEDIHQLKYLKAVIKETLRLHPPLPLLIPRENTHSCEINGYHIPAKIKVIINAWAIGRDPRYWTEAERFKPERFLDSSIDYKGMDFEFIPFGSGRRICPGITFALPNVELPLSQLLYHFDWKLPSGMKIEEFSMTEVFGASVRRKEEVCLVPIRYHP